MYSVNEHVNDFICRKMPQYHITVTLNHHAKKATITYNKLHVHNTVAYNSCSTIHQLVMPTPSYRLNSCGLSGVPREYSV